MQNQLCWWTSCIHSRVARILGQLSKEFRWQEPVWICSSSLFTMPRHSPKSVSSTHSRSKQRSQLSTNRWKGARVFWLKHRMQGSYEEGRIYTTSSIRAPTQAWENQCEAEGPGWKQEKQMCCPSPFYLESAVALCWRLFRKIWSIKITNYKHTLHHSVRPLWLQKSSTLSNCC